MFGLGCRPVRATPQPSAQAQGHGQRATQAIDHPRGKAISLHLLHLPLQLSGRGLVTARAGAKLGQFSFQLTQGCFLLRQCLGILIQGTPQRSRLLPLG